MFEFYSLVPLWLFLSLNFSYISRLRHMQMWIYKRHRFEKFTILFYPRNDDRLGKFPFGNSNKKVWTVYFRQVQSLNRYKAICFLTLAAESWNVSVARNSSSRTICRKLVYRAQTYIEIWTRWNYPDYFFSVNSSTDSCSALWYVLRTTRRLRAVISLASNNNHAKDSQTQLRG